MRVFVLAAALLAAPGARAAQDDASCARSRDWALSRSGLRPFPSQYEEASRQVSLIQEQLVAANGLRLPGLCPAVVLPMRDLAARGVGGTTSDGTAFQFVIVPSALLDSGTKNDAQLAFVLGRELNRLANGTLPESAQLHAQLLPSMGSDDPKGMARYRHLELSADFGGLTYLKRAGYDVDEALGYFQPGAPDTDALDPAEDRLAGLRANLQALDAVSPVLRPVAARDSAVLFVKSASLEEY